MHAAAIMVFGSVFTVDKFITDEMLSQNLAVGTILDFSINDCSNIKTPGIAAAVYGYTELRSLRTATSTQY